MTIVAVLGGGIRVGREGGGEGEQDSVGGSESYYVILPFLSLFFACVCRVIVFVPFVCLP